VQLIASVGIYTGIIVVGEVGNGAIAAGARTQLQEVCGRLPDAGETKRLRKAKEFLILLGE
jgi:hypothetical protein